MDKNILERLRREVFSRQDTLREIVERFGELSLADYVGTWQLKNNLNPVLQGVLAEILGEYYGESSSGEIMEELAQSPLVSTIDHHGLVGHPFFLNSNLIFSLHQNRKFLLCLSTAGVSLNNSSWPAALVYSNEGKLRRLNLIPDKFKTQAVLAAPAADLSAAAKKTDKACLSREKKDKLNSLLAQLSAEPRQENFSRQAGQLSRILWQEYFPGAPQLIYVPIETLTVRLLSGIKSSPQHFLNRLFFTVEGWNLLERYFQGSLGAFSSGHKGSFLFWGLNPSGRRVHLQRQGDRLAGLETAMEIKEIFRYLEQGRIYPTTLVCFVTVALYYGLTCLGGFNQVNWLTDTKKRLLNLMAEWKEDRLAGEIKQVYTQNFAEASLAFMWEEKRLVKPAGPDLYFKKKDWRKQYVGLAGRLSLRQSVEGMLPEIYRIVVPGDQRQDGLLQAGEQEILHLNGGLQVIKEVLKRD